MRWASVATVATLVLMAPTALAAWGMPDPINDRLQTIQDIYLQLLVAGTFVFLFVFGWLVYNLVKFRPGGEGEPTFEDERSNVKAEVIWTVIPILIVAWVGVISYDGFQELKAEPEEPGAEIELTGFQWFWQASYGEDVQLSQQPGAEGSLADAEPFLIPANEPVVVNVTGGDVIHSFWVPELGVKTDATPGRTNTVSFTAPEGEYLIQCAEYCGRDHAYMRAKLKAVPMDEYEQWLSEKEQQAATGELQKTIDVNLTADGIQPGDLSSVAGIKTVFEVTNQGDQARSFTVDGADNGTIDEVPPGETATLETTLEAGDYTVTSDGDEATLTVVEAESTTVTLDEWNVDAEISEFEAGQTYLVTVENVGAVPHNLYVGNPEEKGGSDEVLWKTKDLNAGESTTIIVEPTEDQSGTVTLWCDVSGHYSQGMETEVSITG